MARVHRADQGITLATIGELSPGEQHNFGAKVIASIDLATVRRRSGALDAAAAALALVLSLIPAQRITSLSSRLHLVRTALAAPVFRGSGQARELDERSEEFGRDIVAAGLHALPAIPPDVMAARSGQQTTSAAEHKSADTAVS